MSAPVMAGANGASAAQMAQAQAQAVDAANALYMAKSLEKVALADSPGGALNQAWSAGTALTFTLGDKAGGWLKRLRFTYNLTFTNTPGTGAATTNAAAPYNIIQEIDVNYGGVCFRTRPYYVKVIAEARRFQGFAVPYVVAAPYQHNSTIDTNLRAFTAGAQASGATTWTFTQEIPLNALHALNPSGMVPLSGVSNDVQVTVMCAPSLTGPDPLNNAMVLTGTAALSAISGTVAVEGIYTDGLTMDGTSRLALDLSNVPTTQMWWDNPLMNMTAGGIRRQRITKELRHQFVGLIAIDGQQSNTFVSSESNFNGFELDADSSGDVPFLRFGATLGANISIYHYYEQIRRTYGQDFDPGVLILVDAAARNIADASTQQGRQQLDMTPSGWPGVNYGVYLGAVSTANSITPRLECFGIGVNPLPLQGS